jgi:hypothetical protein
MQSIRRVNVEFSVSMLYELGSIAAITRHPRKREYLNARFGDPDGPYATVHQMILKLEATPPHRAS